METNQVCQPERRAADIGESNLERNLICYWHPGAAGADLDHALSEAGWNILLADNPAAVEAWSATHTIPTGIAFLDSETPENQLDEVYHVITSTPDVIWFVLLKDRSRMHDPVCDLVAQCCFDFYSPPYDHKSIIEVLGHAAGMSLIRHRSMERRETTAAFQGMVGDSPPMRKLFSQILKVARSDAPVLLSGESGTGKELTAGAVHRLSRRSTGPFVAVNCAALPPTLIQSELFGHEKGAFTGATSRRIGRLESAAGGTVFLDEISDMPLDQQVNLLRFLEEKCIERVGGNEKIPIDVRIVVATHDDLQRAVANGDFREDLFFRLNVLELEIPSLRERVSDIELLAHYVARAFSEESGRLRKGGFDKHALRAMNNYPWPGNVRELINRVRRALVMSEGRYISAIDLGLGPGSEDYRPNATLKFSRARVDKNTIESALAHTQDNMSQAARELGISRTTLYRMVDRFNIQPPQHSLSARAQ
jgi:DNA-binding NtrC family response regulator